MKTKNNNIKKTKEKETKERREKVLSIVRWAEQQSKEIFQLRNKSLN